jgi:hypothetical protein
VTRHPNPAASVATRLPVHLSVLSSPRMGGGDDHVVAQGDEGVGLEFDL